MHYRDDDFIKQALNCTTKTMILSGWLCTALHQQWFYQASLALLYTCNDFIKLALHFLHKQYFYQPGLVLSTETMILSDWPCTAHRNNDFIRLALYCPQKQLFYQLALNTGWHFIHVTSLINTFADQTIQQILPDKVMSC